MKNVYSEISEMKDRPVLDSNGQEIGRIKEVEQELRTGRYSTLHIEVAARHTGNTELGGWHHIPLNASEIVMDSDSVRLSRTIESLNSQFTNKISLKHSQHNQREFIDKLVTDKNMRPIGTVKDIRATSATGEFATILVELDKGTQKTSSLEKINWVRIKMDRIENIGQEIRLDRPVEELTREWSEIVIHK